MLSKNEVKDIQSLTHKKFRDALNLFIAEGPKIVRELLQSAPGKIKKLYATEEWIASEGRDFAGVEVTRVTPAELERISQLQTPNSVLALTERFTAVPPEAYSFALYLDAIQDPGNMGTIIRIADWFHVATIVCSSGCADVHNPKVVQASMGSILRVNVYYDDAWLARQKKTIYAAALNGTALPEIQKTEEGILIIGNESKGIGAATLALANKKIMIPRRGGAESLNAAVATGIILSHLLP